MLVEKDNTCKIEGVLSEINLNYGTMTKNNVPQKTITGSIKIRVNQVLPSGEAQELEIPVHMFACEKTNKGTTNPAFESIETVMKSYVSIAASDYDTADRVRITSAKIGMNEYYSSNSGKLVSYPRIQASFISRIKKEECRPEATFSAIFFVGKKGYELDADGVEIKNRYKIEAALPQWGGKVDVVPFIATSENVISVLESCWEVGDTVKANGRLNFTSKTVSTKIDVDFGEAKEEVHTISVSELVIVGGSKTPLDGAMAFATEDIQAALKERQERLAKSKDKAANKGTSGSAPKTNNFADLGF